jgi:hypothetical protein
MRPYSNPDLVFVSSVDPHQPAFAPDNTFAVQVPIDYFNKLLAVSNAARYAVDGDPEEDHLKRMLRELRARVNTLDMPSQIRIIRDEGWQGGLPHDPKVPGYAPGEIVDVEEWSSDGLPYIKIMPGYNISTAYIPIGWEHL